MNNVVNGNFPNHRGTPPTPERKISAFREWAEYWETKYGWWNCLMIIWCVVGGGLTLGIWGALVALNLEGYLW